MIPGFARPALLAGLLLALPGCTITSLGPSGPEAHRLVEQEHARLLDVRTPAEYAAGHITGAVNIPVGELDSRLAEVGPKDQPVVVYCAAGVRSARATHLLQGAGFKRVHDLGGMGNW